MSTSIVEGNKIIKNFIGIIDAKNGGFVIPNDVNIYAEKNMFGVKCCNELLFHSSWDWLMPSWVKFVAIYHELGRKNIYHPTRKLRSEFIAAVDEGNIGKCWEILVEGITWLNSVK